METKISEKTFSTRIVAAYPASACVPKGFTTACTIIMPMDTVDCCKTDGTAMRSMEYSSCRSNLLKGLLYCRIRCRKIQKRKHRRNALCDQRGKCCAKHAQAKPRHHPEIHKNIQDGGKDQQTQRDPRSPMEVNMVERMLYMNKNGKPTK